MSAPIDHRFWKDLVHKQDTINDPCQWRYYEGEYEEDFFDICIHPDLMFNFWGEEIWYDLEGAIRMELFGDLHEIAQKAITRS